MNHPNDSSKVGAMLLMAVACSATHASAMPIDRYGQHVEHVEARSILVAATSAKPAFNAAAAKPRPKEAFNKAAAKPEAPSDKPGGGGGKKGGSGDPPPTSVPPPPVRPVFKPPSI